MNGGQSGLSRFVGNIAPYAMTPYTPTQYSPPALSPWRAPSYSPTIGQPIPYMGGGDSSVGDGGYSGRGGFSGPSLGLSQSAGLIGGLLGGLPGAIGANAAFGPTSNYGMQASLGGLYGIDNMSLEEGSMAPGGSMNPGSDTGGFDYGGMDTSGMDADAAEGTGGYDSGGGGDSK